MKTITIANRKVGPGNPCFIVAEIGINHNGNMQIACDTILAAKKAGADAVKFQNYHVDEFLFDNKLLYTYPSQGKEIIESQYDIFKRNELSFQNLCVLKKCCDEIGITLFSTPTDKKGVDELVKLKVPVLKNGSDFLENLCLLEEMAATNLPIIISTGMATLSEIDEAVRAYESAGGNQLIILHCVSNYPTKMNDVHLNKIANLVSIFGYPVGFSDHTEGNIAAIGAVAKGACVIEKHFTLDKNLPGPDHVFSSDPGELSQLVTAIRQLEICLGDSRIKPTFKEIENKNQFRLSCAVKRDMKIGDTIQKQDLAYIRPAGKGVSPKFYRELMGAKLIKPMQRGSFLNFEDIRKESHEEEL